MGKSCQLPFVGVCLNKSSGKKDRLSIADLRNREFVVPQIQPISARLPTCAWKKAVSHRASLTTRSIHGISWHRRKQRGVLQTGICSHTMTITAPSLIYRKPNPASSWHGESAEQKNTPARSCKFFAIVWRNSIRKAFITKSQKRSLSRLNASEMTSFFWHVFGYVAQKTLEHMVCIIGI